MNNDNNRFLFLSHPRNVDYMRSIKNTILLWRYKSICTKCIHLLSSSDAYFSHLQHILWGFFSSSLKEEWSEFVWESMMGVQMSYLISSLTASSTWRKFRTSSQVCKFSDCMRLQGSRLCDPESYSEIYEFISHSSSVLLCFLRWGLSGRREVGKPYRVALHWVLSVMAERIGNKKERKKKRESMCATTYEFH